MSPIKLLYETVRSKVVGSPFAYFTVKAWSKKIARFRVNADTELVIEGFPRSANTYALHAFMQMQLPREVNVAHHIHTAAHIKAAVSLKKPVLLLVREPKGAVASLKMRRKNASLETLVFRYIKFHEALLESLDAVIVAKFDHFVESPHVYIQMINEQFETQFCANELSVADREVITESILKVNKGLGSNTPVTQSMPSPEKTKLRIEIEKEMDERCLKLFERAQAVYDEIIALDNRYS